MTRLIWVFAGLTLILLILSCRGSNYLVYMQLVTRSITLLCPICYRKTPKHSDTPKICCNHPKIWTRWLYRRVMHPNDAAGIANSVDPDQTAPLIWVYTVYLGLSVRKLRIITVFRHSNSTKLKRLFCFFLSVSVSFLFLRLLILERGGRRGVAGGGGGGWVILCW